MGNQQSTTEKIREAEAKIFRGITTSGRIFKIEEKFTKKEFKE